MGGCGREISVDICDAWTQKQASHRLQNKLGRAVGTGCIFLELVRTIFTHRSHGLCVLVLCESATRIATCLPCDTCKSVL